MPKNKILVLLIEDDPIFQKVLENKIKTIINCHVTICANIEQAKNSIIIKQDLIITDHFLPDGNSFDVLNFIKKEGLQVPVIILSEQPEIAVAVELMSKGAHTYIEKSNIGLTKLDKIITELTPYFTLKSDLKNTYSMLFGGRQLFAFILMAVFLCCIYFIFKK